MTDNLSSLVEHILPGGLSFIIFIIGFWISVGKHMVTKSDVEKMIQLHSPYVEDRQFILERLKNNKEMQESFADALDKNSDVMNELRIQIACLSNTLENIEKYIDRE